MPKKQPKNAFFFFMLDVKRKEEARGRRFPNGLAGVSEMASEQWNKLTPQEKGPFEKQAAIAKQTPSGGVAGGERYTSQGIPFSQLDRINAELKLAEENMHKEINHLVKHSFLNNTISTQEYTFVAANYFCKTHSNVYVPAELALLKYTAAEGFGKKFHVFIDPGQLPSGYAYEAQSRSKTVHRLPPPPKAMGDKSYDNVLQNILRFFGVTTSKQLPPMFTNTDQVPVLKSIIEQLCQNSYEDPKNFRVYPITQLLFVWKQETSKFALNEGGAFYSVHIAQSMIDRDQYDYRENLACTFHEEQDASKFCSLSVVIRWSFIFSDHLCADLGIQFIPGRHIPSDSDMSAPKIEHKDDDCGASVISAAPSGWSNLTTSNTAYTQWNNDCASLAASEVDTTQMSFPALDGGARGSRNPTKSVSKGKREGIPVQSVGSDDRNKRTARVPLENSLSFPVGGRGIGLLKSHVPEAQRSLGRGLGLIKSEVPEAQRSLGRGRFF